MTIAFNACRISTTIFNWIDISFSVAHVSLIHVDFPISVITDKMSLCLKLLDEWFCNAMAYHNGLEWQENLSLSSVFVSVFNVAINTLYIVRRYGAAVHHFLKKPTPKPSS